MADVLEVLRAMAGCYEVERGCAVRKTVKDGWDAVEKVAELIAANEEYDSARIERGRWLLCELNDEGLAALVRWHNAIERRAAALAAMKEG